MSKVQSRLQSREINKTHEKNVMKTLVKSKLCLVGDKEPPQSYVRDAVEEIKDQTKDKTSQTTQCNS